MRNPTPPSDLCSAASYQPPIVSHYESVKGLIRWLGQSSYDLIYFGNVLIEVHLASHHISSIKEIAKTNHRSRQL